MKCGMVPYGGNSSRKNLMASIDQSLRRTGLDYFDIFYSHRYDGVTPVEETMQALIDIVKQGKALYVGISKYPPAQAKIAYEMLRLPVCRVSLANIVIVCLTVL